MPPTPNLPSPSTEQLIAWDRQFLWHPFTPMKPWCESKDILVIEKGDREFLIDTLGRRYIDGVSSLWCNVHGHNVPELNAAVTDQLAKIAHSSLLGLANVPSILLAKRLVQLAQAAGLNLARAFYSDNGSTAVEVACKMAYQYWANHGTPPKFLALRNAYHGDTLGAVSLGGIPLFHAAFHGLTFPVDFLDAPSPASLDALEDRLKHNASSYAAIIVEPLVLGAGGMLMYPPEHLVRLRQLADRYHTLLIHDEVLTAFGRTGTMFASEHASPPSQQSKIENRKSPIPNPASPDLLCLSKGLTAGYMPLGVTLASQKIFDAFYVDPNVPGNLPKTFFHGHTFTGHPLACAVALASLDLFEKKRLLDHVAALTPILADMLEKARHKPHVARPRHLGLIGALDLVDDNGAPFPPSYRIGGEFCTRLRPLGILLRPLADTLVIMPPLAIAPDTMHRLCDTLFAQLDDLPAIIAAKKALVPT